MIRTFLYNAPFEFWFACFVGNFVFFTSPRRVKKCTLLRVSPSSPFMSTGTRRCQHRPILFEQPRALAVLKFVFLLLFILCCHLSSINILQKPTLTQARLVHKRSISHAKGCLRVISNTRICVAFYIWKTILLLGIHVPISPLWTFSVLRSYI